jgi:hypothetical protein
MSAVTAEGVVIPFSFAWRCSHRLEVAQVGALLFDRLL